MSETIQSAILGFRRWVVDTENEMLVSCMNKIPWQPGINHATGCAHRSPDPNCHCGFNAWFDIGDAERNYSGVIGAIAGAGRTELHNDGFRSSEAQILCLFSEERRAELEKISKKYGVPVFSERQEFLDFLILFREATKRVIEDFELNTSFESEPPPAPSPIRSLVLEDYIYYVPIILSVIMGILGLVSIVLVSPLAGVTMLILGFIMILFALEC